MATTDLRDFTLSLERFAESIPERVETLHKAATLETVSGVVQMTPVDTGRLRANWQVQHDTPPEDYIDVAYDGDPAANASAAMRAAMERAAGVIAETRPYTVTWIHNGVPYAVYVNDGTEKMAGQRMVETTVERVSGWLERQPH